MLSITALVIASTPAPTEQVAETLVNTPTSLVATLGSVASLAIVGALVWVGRIVKQRLERVLNQTENSHQATDYPNLRDELTATRQAAEQAVTVVGDLAQTVRDDRTSARAETEGVRQDLRALSQRLDLHIVETIRSQKQ
jgi:hypothetical protein